MLADVDYFVYHTVQNLGAGACCADAQDSAPKIRITVAESFVKTTGADILQHLGNDRIGRLCPEEGIEDTLLIICVEGEIKNNIPAPDSRPTNSHN